MALPQQYERYTWQDYLSWPEDERWELIQGVACAMRPAPATGHQRIVAELSRQISNYLLDKLCEVLVAPFDLKLSSEEDERTHGRAAIYGIDDDRVNAFFILRKRSLITKGTVEQLLT